MKEGVGLLLGLTLAFRVLASNDFVQGFSLTETDRDVYDAAADPKDQYHKTAAQKVVDRLYTLGVRQINLSPRATMQDGWASHLEPVTPAVQQGNELGRYLRLIQYIKSKGMKVGIRPIFFVIDESGKTPRIEGVPLAYADRLRTAAAALHYVALDPSSAKTQLPAAESALSELVGLLTPKAGRARARARFESWMLRRVIHLRGEVVVLESLSGSQLSTEAGKSAVKADLLSQDKKWWHGDIEPEDPSLWFASFQDYLRIYLKIARLADVDEFTIGAELLSMTVGEEQWDEQPLGFPLKWAETVKLAKDLAPKGCRVMYDINFTDEANEFPLRGRAGGELERWRYRLVDLAHSSDPAVVSAWRELMGFWNSLDAIGIDLYRSLADKDQEIPAEYDKLVQMLETKSDQFAKELDETLKQIQSVQKIDSAKPVILKEVGFRSAYKGFIDPFLYAGAPGEVNLFHQAAGYECILHSFAGEKWSRWSWFKGIVFWDASVDLTKHGPLDLGFSPIGKFPTEGVLQRYFHP